MTSALGGDGVRRDGSIDWGHHPAGLGGDVELIEVGTVGELKVTGEKESVLKRKIAWCGAGILAWVFPRSRW